MKKFDSLEQEEKALCDSASKNIKKDTVPYIPVIVGVLAVAIIAFICIKLFSSKPAYNTTTTAKKYQVEVDGKTYSADTIEELNEMVGFDISFAFNNQNNEELSTHVEKELYGENETATIETESGTYSLEITDVQLKQRSPGRGSDIIYHISYKVTNKDFGVDGNGVCVDPTSFIITDQSGNNCGSLNREFHDEQENAYEWIRPGNSLEKKCTASVVDLSSEFLNIQLSTRGVNFKVPVNNLESFTESHKSQQISIGTPVIISDYSGEMIITVDDIKIANEYLFSSPESEKLVVIDLDINNIDYIDLGANQEALSIYNIKNHLELKDNDGYVINSYDGGVKGNNDHGYYFYMDGDISSGSKVRVAVCYLVSKDCNKITLDFKNGTTLLADLK